MDYSPIGIGVSEAISPKTIPDWDSYFMSMVDIIRSRSKDSNTNHGCLVVDKNNIVKATGYNSFPSGADDQNLPNNRLNNFKRVFISHAEESLIFSAARNGIPLEGCRIYISGRPCCHCARKLISVGILDWIVGDVGHVESETDKLLFDYWVDWYKVKITYYKGK